MNTTSASLLYRLRQPGQPDAWTRFVTLYPPLLQLWTRRCRTPMACWEYVVAGRPAVEVAAELGIAAGTMYVARARILSRLRQKLEGLLD
jgi:hypothetical protein